jgi:DNA-binding response OmpR family regulator
MAHIFIVEDEPRLAALLADYLKAAGHETTWIADGHEVVAVVNRRAPDVVLLDLMLPGRDGLDLCRELRSTTQVRSSWSPRESRRSIACSASSSAPTTTYGVGYKLDA